MTVSGPYVLEVHTLEGTGTTAVHLQRLAAATACDSTIAGCDTLRTASLNSEVDSDLFEFTVVDGERVRITAAGATGNLGSRRGGSSMPTGGLRGALPRMEPPSTAGHCREAAIRSKWVPPGAPAARVCTCSG